MAPSALPVAALPLALRKRCSAWPQLKTSNPLHELCPVASVNDPPRERQCLKMGTHQKKNIDLVGKIWENDG